MFYAVKCTVIMLFAVGTGLSTAAGFYDCKQVPQSMKSIGVLMVVFLSAVFLNFCLYVKEIRFNPKTEVVGLKSLGLTATIANISAIVITFASSVGFALFILWSIPDLPYNIPHALVWIFAISAGFATFFLYIGDTKKIIECAIEAITAAYQGLKSTRFNFSCNNLRTNLKKYLLKFSLIAIFCYGTIGYLKTVFKTIKDHLSQSTYFLAIILVVLLTISEFTFITESAFTFVDSTYENITSGGLKLFLISPILINGAADGFLDAVDVAHGLFVPTLICGFMHSALVMANGVFNSATKEPDNSEVRSIK